ncbi:MAG: hypothetical protein IPH77_12795 [Ignavibacteria bacterium]|nr:hypothetical protein [Ignavibacteria bacterium]
MPVEKNHKNSWKADTSDQKIVDLNTKYLYNELTVRTSEVNTEHAFLSSARFSCLSENLKTGSVFLKLTFRRTGKIYQQDLLKSLIMFTLRKIMMCSLIHLLKPVISTYLNSILKESNIVFVFPERVTMTKKLSLKISEQ